VAADFSDTRRALSRLVGFMPGAPSFWVPGDSMTEQEVLAPHHKVFYEALMKQDYVALSNLYADNYMLVRSNGSVLNKAEVLNDLKNGGLIFKSIELSNPEVRVLGSTAILTGESRTVSLRNGAETSTKFRLVAVYAKEAESIKLVYFQSTSLPQ
jgi:ketosteroid isomerase-like protein